MHFKGIAIATRHQHFSYSTSFPFFRGDGMTHHHTSDIKVAGKPQEPRGHAYLTRLASSTAKEKVNEEHEGTTYLCMRDKEERQLVEREKDKSH